MKRQSRITADEVQMIEDFGRACWNHDGEEAANIIQKLIASFEGEEVLNEIRERVEAKLGRQGPTIQ